MTQSHQHQRADSSYSSLADSHRSNSSFYGSNVSTSDTDKNQSNSNSSNNTPRNRPNKKPNPLKQRTSSIDTRKDYSYFSTWWSLRDLIKFREWFVTVNNFPIWRRHLAWAMEEGSDLRNSMTSRYASSMVFLSLLLAAEVNVLFDSAAITTDMRRALQMELYTTLQFWIGVTILISILLTLLSLIITYTAWGIVSAISDENAHCILRSSIGQYVGELPHRFIVASIYSFLLWISLTIFLLLPVGLWSVLLLTLLFGLFVHVVMVFSLFGRLILHTTAMSPNRIFEEGYEKSLTPQPLQEQLYVRAKAEISNNTSITRQYRRKLEPMGRRYDQDELAGLLRQGRLTEQPPTHDDESSLPPMQTIANAHIDHRFTNNYQRTRSTSLVNHGTVSRARTDSTVRFADQLLETSNNHNISFNNTGVLKSKDDNIPPAKPFPHPTPRQRLLTPTAENSSVASSMVGQASPKIGKDVDSANLTDPWIPVATPPRIDPSAPQDLLRHESIPPSGFTVDSLKSWLTTSTSATASPDEEVNPTPATSMCGSTSRMQPNEMPIITTISSPLSRLDERQRNFSTVSSCSMDDDSDLLPPLPSEQTHQEQDAHRNATTIPSALMYGTNSRHALTEDEKFNLDYGHDEDPEFPYFQYSNEEAQRLLNETPMQNYNSTLDKFPSPPWDADNGGTHANLNQV